jgi:hypothetical protein
LQNIFEPLLGATISVAAWAFAAMWFDVTTFPDPDDLSIRPLDATKKIAVFGRFRWAIEYEIDPNCFRTGLVESIHQLGEQLPVNRRNVGILFECRAAYGYQGDS